MINTICAFIAVLILFAGILFTVTETHEGVVYSEAQYKAYGEEQRHLGNNKLFNEALTEELELCLVTVISSRSID